MSAPLDISHGRYGRLVAIRRAPDKGRRTQWLFSCDCGKQATLGLENVRSGITKSCGCLRIEQTAARSLKHGHSVGRKSSRTLKSYQHAKSRCFNPADEKFPHYGGRGITMCKRWADDFSAFLEDMGECPEGMSIGRKDVDKDYTPDNCRWETTAQQARARTDNVWVVRGDDKMVLKDFAALMGVPYKALHYRVRYKGFKPEEAAAHLLSLKR